MGQWECGMNTTLRAASLRKAARSGFPLGSIRHVLKQEFLQSNRLRVTPKSCKIEWSAINQNEETEKSSSEDILRT